MKTFFTRQLISYAVVALIWTLLFRYFLSDGIERQSGLEVLSSSVLYAMAMFITGWYFGKRDQDHLPIFDIGFRFHLMTYVVHNAVTLAWFLGDYQASRETANVSMIIAIVWGSVLLIHLGFYLWVRRHSIKGLRSDQLFE